MNSALHYVLMYNMKLLNNVIFSTYKVKSVIAARYIDSQNLPLFTRSAKTVVGVQRDFGSTQGREL